MGGIIYLEIVDKSCILKPNEENMDHGEETVGPQWWGRRFEQLCRNFPAQIKQTNEEEKESKDEKGEMITLFKAELNAHTILMAAEIDAVDESMQFVEIKTQKYIKPKGKTYQNKKYPTSQSVAYSNYKPMDADREKQRYHPYRNDKAEQKTNRANDFIVPWYKVLKIWIQSYLGGVDNILMGFRDEKGFVVDVNMFKLDYFTKKLNYFNKRTQRQVSKANVCLNFADNVLTFIKNNCKSEDCVYRIVYNEPWTHLILC